jgi:hypothetical protein
MVDKSNEYGYVPSSPTQAKGANTGIFEVNDVTDLLLAGQWITQTEPDNLNLIYEYTFTGSESAVTILSTDIDSSVYRTLYIVGDLEGTSMTSMSFNVSQDDFSTIYATNGQRGTMSMGTTGSATRTYSNTSATLGNLTEALSGDLTFAYTLNNLTDSFFTTLTGMSQGYNGSSVKSLFGYGEFGSASFNSFKFNIDNVDAGSTIKFYGYVSA